MFGRKKDFRMKEIWIEVDAGEKDFRLDFVSGTRQRRLRLKGDTYYFENIYSYRNYSQKTIRIKLTQARKVD